MTLSDAALFLIAVALIILVYMRSYCGPLDRDEPKEKR